MSVEGDIGAGDTGAGVGESGITVGVSSIGKLSKLGPDGALGVSEKDAGGPTKESPPKEGPDGGLGTLGVTEGDTGGPPGIAGAGDTVEAELSVVEPGGAGGTNVEVSVDDPGGVGVVKSDDGVSVDPGGVGGVKSDDDTVEAEVSVELTSHLPDT